MLNNEVIMFLGSGVSLGSNLPCVKQITHEIFHGNYNFSKDALLDFKLNSNNYLEDTTMKRIRALLKLIEEIDQELVSDSAPFKMGEAIYKSGALFKNFTTYEDLYFIITEIHKTSQGLSNNSMSNAIILYIESRAGEILEGNSKFERIIDLNKLCTICINFLDWLIPTLLIHKEIGGIDLILECAKSSKKLSIITLNHDLTIEDLFQRNNIDYDDGFGMPSTAMFNKFKGFKETSKIKIIKPHGSIQWMHYDGGICRFNKLKIMEQSEYRLMRVLTGTNKILAYNMGVFSEMFFQLHKSFSKSKTMIMSGYGWGDEGINMRLNDWLNKKVNKLLLMHKEPTLLKESSYVLQSVMRNYVKNGKIILIEKWLSEVKYKEIEHYLN